MSKLPLWPKIVMYYLAAYLLTGIFFILQVTTGIKGEFIQLPQIGPALAAIIFIALEGNSIKMFLTNGFRFLLNRFTVVMILVSIALILSISILTSSLWGIENFKSSNINVLSIFLVLSTVIAAICEEIGWRGYLLPKLQSRMTPVKSSIILGILWGFWHVPKLLMGVQSFAVWFVGIMGLTFILTYTFNRTGSNIWAVTLIHSSVNLMSNFFLLGVITDLRVNLLNSIGYVLWAVVLILFGKKYNKFAVYTKTNVL